MGKPMKAIESIWETSCTGFKMPTTVNQYPPIHTCVGWARFSMPSRLAVSAPEHDRREVGRRRVEECAVRHRGPQGGRQGGVGGGERDAVGVDARHERGAIHVGIGDGADLGHVRDRPDARHHALGGGGQLGLLTEGGAGGLDGEEVAELPQLVEQTRSSTIGRCRARRRSPRCRC